MEGLLAARTRRIFYVFFLCLDFLCLLTIDYNVFLAYTDVFQDFHFKRGFQTARELIHSFQKK